MHNYWQSGQKSTIEIMPFRSSFYFILSSQDFFNVLALLLITVTSLTVPSQRYPPKTALRRAAKKERKIAGWRSDVRVAPDCMFCGLQSDEALRATRHKKDR